MSSIICKRLYLMLPILICALLSKASADESAKLLKAAEENNIAAVKAILKNDPKLVNTKTAFNETPLHLAARNGSLDMCCLLIEKGAKVDAMDCVNDTPLHEAAREYRRGVAELLVAKGANVNVKNSQSHTPLHTAVDRGDYYIAMMLARKGADPNVRDNIGNTPLLTAIGHDKIELVKLLVECGADVNARAPKTPTDVIRSASASTIEQDQVGPVNGPKDRLTDDTPLKIALELRRSDIADYLRKHGAAE